MSTFTTSRNHNLYYIDKGEGEPIVLVHGWSGSIENFVFLKKDLLEAGYRVIAIDHRGHGKSQIPDTPPLIEDLADDLHELIEMLKLDSFTLLGYSMGVFVSFEYLLKYAPSNVKQFILVDMTPRLVADKEAQTGLYHCGVPQENVPGFLQEMRDDFKKWWLGFFEKASLLEITPESEQMAMEALGEYDLDVLVTLFKDMFDKDYRGKLDSIKVPATLIHAEPGSLYSIRDAMAMKESLPQLELKSIENSTHLLVITHPAQFNQMVLNVLSSK